MVHGRDPRLPTDVLAGTPYDLDIDALNYGLFLTQRSTTSVQLLKLIKSQPIIMANAITITAIIWFTLPTEALSIFIGSPVFLPSSLTTMKVLSEFDATCPTFFMSFSDRSTY